KSRVRKQDFGKSVKCQYCLETFVVSPGMGPRTKIFDSFRLKPWLVGAVLIIYVSTFMYLLRKNIEVGRRLDKAEEQIHEELRKPEKEAQHLNADKVESPRRHYLFVFDCIDDTGYHKDVREEVDAENKESAESIIRKSYGRSLKIKSVVEMKE